MMHVTASIDQRHSRRLTTSLSGTNLVRAGDYNQRVVLQAVRVSGETTRTALVAQTGLTQPTIANITRRLIDSGYVEERGQLAGSRGVRPQRLAVHPDGAIGIGVNIDRDHITIVSLDLAGNIRSRVTREVAFPLPDDAVECVMEEIDDLVARRIVDPDRVLGLGIGVPGFGLGVGVPGGISRVPFTHPSTEYGAWEHTDLRALFGSRVAWPVHVENDAAAAVIGEMHFGAGLEHASFFYLLITVGLGGGVVIDGSYCPGSTKRGGHIGLIEGRDGKEHEYVVSLAALSADFQRQGYKMPAPGALGDLTGPRREIVDDWIERAADRLAEPLRTVNCLLDPEAILIGGRLPSSLIDRLAERTNARMGGDRGGLMNVAPVRRATLSADAPAVGAAIMPFTDTLLPSDSILMTARA